MKYSIPILFVAAALFTPASGLTAQDSTAAARFQPVLGEWHMSMETPRGNVTQQLVFTLSGSLLAGVVNGQRGSTPLKDVRFEDGRLMFTLERSFNGRTMSQQFSATLDDDEMKGTIAGGRGGDRPFTAKRKAT
ncbi:MAG TPA: hypothetical protein VGA37_07985 [Gemmatimonadales bacterium]